MKTIENLGEIIEEVKKHLQDYLKLKKWNLEGKLIKCPNYREHSHNDRNPSANFYPDENHIHCFRCSLSKGDIFDVYSILENKDIEGDGFTEAIEYLCKLFNIPYKYKALTEEDKFLIQVENFLNALVNKGHSLLREVIKDRNHNITKFLINKNWIKSIDKFKLSTINSIKGNFKKIYDRLDLNPAWFKGNLIIPIYSRTNRLVGFQLRQIEKNLPKKYSTHILSKKVLYNLNNTKRLDKVFMVEGASSVIALNSKGISNVVAMLGNSFSDDHYASLVKSKIKEITLCFDADEGGFDGLKRALVTLSNKYELKVNIKILPENKDPAEVDDFLAVKEIPYISYLIELFMNGNKWNAKDLLFSYIASNPDFLAKEELIKQITSSLKFTKQTVLEELKKYEPKSVIKTIDLVREKDGLIDSLNEFEQYAWSRGSLLGLPSFKSFDYKLDGIQRGLILIAGAPKTYKSALCISLALKMLQRSNDIYIAYFSVDDSAFTTLSRFLANLSGLPINVVANPNFKIVKNKLLDTETRRSYIKKREDALDFLRKKASLINLKDASEGYTIEFIKEKLYIFKQFIKDKKLVVFIDNLHDLRTGKRYMSDNAMYNIVCGELNTLANSLEIPLICSVHMSKSAIQNNVKDGTGIKDTVETYYAAKLILQIEVPDEGDDDTIEKPEVLPVYIRVTKNKFSGFEGRIPFTVYRVLSKVEEKIEEEEDNRLFS